jgi:hypothetical protein
MKKVFTARTADEKLRQRQYFFWYNPNFKSGIIKSLQKLKRQDLIQKLFRTG